jgi:hypothetical protein
MESVSFGFAPEFDSSFGTGNVGSVYSLDSGDCFITTARALFRLENGRIRDRLPYTFLLSCLIPRESLIVGYGFKGYSLTVIWLRDIRRPLLNGHRIDHGGIYHISHCELSSKLVLIGEAVYIYGLQCLGVDPYAGRMIPQVSVNFETTIPLRFEIPLLNPPVIDGARGLLFLPEPPGIVAYNLDGSVARQITKAGAMHSTALAWDPAAQRLMTADTATGLAVWDYVGYHCGSYTAGTSAVFSAHFLDAEHALLLNSLGIFFILNLKTQKAFACNAATGVPSRVIVQKSPFLAVFLITGPRVVCYRIRLVWRLWAEQFLQATVLQRYAMHGVAARMLVRTDDAFISILSPRDGRRLAVASVASLAAITAVSYTRGAVVRFAKPSRCAGIQVPIPGNDVCYEIVGNDREELVVLTNDGRITRYLAAADPCEAVDSFDFNATAMTLCCPHKGNWFYALARSSNEVIVCDFVNFKPQKRVLVGHQPIWRLFFDEDSERLIFVRPQEIDVYDLEHSSMVQRCSAAGSSVAVWNRSALILGHKSGDIDIWEMRNGVLERLGGGNESKKAHNAAVTDV